MAVCPCVCNSRLPEAVRGRVNPHFVQNRPEKARKTVGNAASWSFWSGNCIFIASLPHFVGANHAKEGPRPPQKSQTWLKKMAQTRSTDIWGCSRASSYVHKGRFHKTEIQNVDIFGSFNSFVQKKTCTTVHKLQRRENVFSIPRA